MRPGTAQHTDLANAESLVDQHGEDLLYCAQWDKWLAWDGKRFCLDDTGAVHRCAAEVTRDLFRQCADVMTEAFKQRERAQERGDVDAEREWGQRAGKAKRDWEWAVKSQSSRALSAMVSVAESDERIAIRYTDLDADPMKLNVLNGTLDLQTQSLSPHSREDRITKLAPVNYDPTLDCPTWTAFVDRIMGGNRDVIKFVQRMCGYALTGSIREHVLGFFFGGGANGKSTFLRAIYETLGDYAQPAPRGLIQEKKADSHPTELASLFRARFVVCSEVEPGKPFAETLIKDLTGGDPIMARRMREDFWPFDPTHKLFIAGNSKPVIRGDDEGIWRRVRLIPFNVQIPIEERDTSLPERLRQEREGIFAWCVRGCADWLQNGLGEPKEVMEATAAYRDEMDTTGEFLDRWCAFEADAKTPRQWIRKIYEEWCAEVGIKRPLEARSFAAKLKARGVTDANVKVDGKVKDGWRGIRLKTETERLRELQ